MKGSAARWARNVYEVLSKLPRHGVGARLQKNTWKEDSYWDVVKVKMELSGAAGKSYGLLTWRGTKMHEEPRRIPGTRKKVWRLWSSGGDGGVPEAGRRFDTLDKALIDSLDSEPLGATEGDATEDSGVEGSMGGATESGVEDGGNA